MSLTIQNTAAGAAVNALAPVTPLAKRMEQEHHKGTAEDSHLEPGQELPAPDADPVVPDQGEDGACDDVENAQSNASSDPKDAFIERVVTGPRTGDAMLAMRLSPASVPTVPTSPENAQPAAADPGAATPATEGDVPATPKPGHTSNPAPPSAGAPHVSAATSGGVVGNGRGAAPPASASAPTGADASLDPEAPRVLATETAGAAGRQESNAAPVPALTAQDVANRHSADAAAGNAGQARSEADTASQRNLQHVQQAQKTAEVLAQRASAGARMDVAFTSWGPGNSVSLSRQPGGHWTAIPSNARVGQALGSNTPNDLQVRQEGETLRVEEGSMTDPDGRRRQQHEQDAS